MPCLGRANGANRQLLQVTSGPDHLPADDRDDHHHHQAACQRGNPRPEERRAIEGLALPRLLFDPTPDPKSM